jgi:hypothetical protein
MKWVQWAFSVGITWSGLEADKIGPASSSGVVNNEWGGSDNINVT